ncbi:hypothetical protein J4526_01765 [Desulfurococcaceae archaeon MEX13E-LK6-19]|nr:hypothetical protein J4526_01765 [Desulfurococcaceae archaeon MEX13E-LK6-19]
MSLEVFSVLSDEEREELEKAYEDIVGVECRKRNYLLLSFIFDAIECNELQPIIITGRRGAGKSTYALKVVAQYFMRQGLSCGEAYLEALNRIVHTPKEFFDALKKYNDIIIWDDAGVWLSTYFWYHPELRPYLIWFLNWFDTSRTDVKVLVFTTPTKKKLPPRVREDPESLHVRVRRVGTKIINGLKVKVAEAHIVVLDESDYMNKLYTEDVGSDQYVVYLPDPVYRAYSIIRDGYHRLAKKMLGKVLVEKGLIPEELVEGYTYTSTEIKNLS